MGKIGSGTASTLAVASNWYEKKPISRSACTHKAIAIVYRTTLLETLPFVSPHWLKMIEILTIKVSTFNRVAEVGGIMDKVLYGPTSVLPYS
jgi:hypothetical protein